MMQPLILALDFGGTKLSAAIARQGEQAWRAHRRVFTPEDADGPYEYRLMLDIARELIAETGQPAAIGVSFGGPVDTQRGVVRLSHHVKHWENTPLRQKLQAEFGVPVVVDNDANVAALGEYRFGAGEKADPLLYLTVSTGIGGGWIIGGKIYHGANGMAGEIGHTVVNPGGMPCVCGKRGCIEAEASGAAIAHRARQMIDANPADGRLLLAGLGVATHKITAKHISEAAAQGDLLARQVLTESARFLGQGIGGAVTLMNPRRVILGGGVTKAGNLWWRTVLDTARRYALPEIPVEIVSAALGDDAPLWGAVVLAGGSTLQKS